jgi:alpha-L-fucosidase
MKQTLFAAMGLVLLTAPSPMWAQEIAGAPTTESSRDLLADFRKLEFGMFIHYNMATYKGVQWVEGYPDPATFDPGGRIDTDAWADAAVSAGMTYGVLTAKHVGGFCLWDSKHTTYDVMHPDCPYKQDLIAQFIKSFKSRGLKVGLYYCWRHPGFDKGKNKGKFKVLPPECDPASHSLEEQIQFQKAQIAELLEKYPDVFYLWNDALDPDIMPAEEARKFIKAIRPNILASSNWWNWGKKGTPYLDIAVKEMRHFPEDNTAPGETCWKLEPGWFWNKGARTKTAGGVVNLVTMVNGRNSNFLLNVGPDRNGQIIESSTKTLAEIGKLWKPQPSR